MWKIEIIDDYSPGWTLVLKHIVKSKHSDKPFIMTVNDLNGINTAKIMGIEHKTFIDTLIVKYNALLYKDIIYFPKFEDFQKSFEWIESGILIRTLNDDI